MNIIKDISERIDQSTNKVPCKSYATEAAAEKATAEVAMGFAKAMHQEVSAEYIVFFHAGLQRWVGAINGRELCSRAGAAGYVAYAASKGFYTF